MTVQKYKKILEKCSDSSEKVSVEALFAVLLPVPVMSAILMRNEIQRGLTPFVFLVCNKTVGMSVI